jgi:hypothetical protein
MLHPLRKDTIGATRSDCAEKEARKKRLLENREDGRREFQLVKIAYERQTGTQCIPWMRINSGQLEQDDWGGQDVSISMRVCVSVCVCFSKDEKLQ